MSLHENQEILEHAVLIGVHKGLLNTMEDCTEESLLELASLAETAGATVAGTILQNRQKICSATYLGEGKIAEITEFAKANDANLIICDDELSPSQLKNIENLTGIKTIDRSRLILDIFARRATTKEGKYQVELAQLSYLRSRLVGSSAALSRLGGGIGTRGPGETKLESDRRHIGARIAFLKKELSELSEHRGRIRQKRQKSQKPIIALVGYTNAGKSSLLNALTNANALSEDKLFATLDPLVRGLTISDTCEALLVDTVGFIRKLPHSLIEAFHSTLEEAAYADLLIHLIDASSPEWEIHKKVAENILAEIGAAGKPTLLAFNKCDLLPDTSVGVKNSVEISCKTGQGIPGLLKKCEEMLPERKKRAKFLIPYSDGAVLSLIHKEGEVLSLSHTANGTLADAVVDVVLYEKIKSYREEG